MSSRVYFRCVTFVLAGAYFGIVMLRTESEASDEMRARFLTEAPRGWETLERFLATREGTVVDTGKPVEGLPDTDAFQVVHEFKHVGENILHRTTGDAQGIKMDIVDVVNAKYGFSLTKDPKIAGSPWRTRYVGSTGRVEERINKTAEVLFIPYMIDMQSLPWTVSQPGFDLRSVEAIDKEGHEVVRMVFLSSDAFRPDYRVVGGSVLLDPSLNWAVLEYDLDIQLDEPGKMYGKVEYSGDIDGCPVPARVTKDQVFERIGIHRRRTFEFERMVESMAAPEDFTLTAFGLPEVAIGSPPRRSFIFIWMTVLAIICLAISLWFRRESRNDSFVGNR